MGIDTTIKELKSVGTESNESLRNSSEIVQLFGELCRCDGHLIPIKGIRSRMNEPLFIATRLEVDHFDKEKQFLAIDVVANRNGVYIPVGMKDYEIEKGVANGNKQRHDHFSHNTEVDEYVAGFWASGNGLSVVGDTFLKYAESHPSGFLQGMTDIRDLGLIQEESDWSLPVYQKLGLAKLMTAVSIIVLRYYDIKAVKTVSLTSNAIKTWMKFGIGGPGTYSLDDIIQRPKIMEVAREAFQVE